MRSRPPLLYLGFVLCACIWGSTFLAIRIGNDVMAPIWACAVRLVVAAPVLCLLVVIFGNQWPKGAALKGAVWYGVWEFGIGLSLLYWGESTVPSGLAAVLYATCPVSAMLISRAYGLEDLNFKKLGAALLALAGLVAIFWGEVRQGGPLLGLLAIFLAACSASLAGVMLQRGPKQSALGANAVGTLVSIPLCAIFSLVIDDRHVIPTTAREIYPVVYLAIASSVIAFGTFAWLLTHWKVSSVAFLGVIVPVLAAVLGHLILNEKFPVLNLVGAVVILVAVIVALKAETSSSAASSS